jgi:hypothetical protein
LNNRKTPEQYVNRAAYENYLKSNPNDEFYSVFPIEEGPWQDSSDLELLAENAAELRLRDEIVSLPSADMYKAYGIELQKKDSPRVFELSRLLAATRAETMCFPSYSKFATRRVGTPRYNFESACH